MSKHWRSQGIALPDLLILLIILLAVGCLWYASGFWIDANVASVAEKDKLLEAAGQFGDKFGAINSLFSGFAFAAIVFTIILQNRELQSTKKAMVEQSKTTNSQRFDNTFFQLLSLHNEITANLTDLQNSGRNSFLSFHERLIKSDPDFAAFGALSKLKREQIRQLIDSKTAGHTNIPDSLKGQLEDADISNIEASLETGLACFHNYLDNSVDMHERKLKNAYTAAAVIHIDKYSHYFRNLYHILRFIKESNLIPDSDRSMYVKIVRSQLSEIELVALFYNSLSQVTLPGREEMELGHPKMGKLLAEFDILQNMSPRSIIHPSHKTIFNTNNGVQK